MVERPLKIIVTAVAATLLVKGMPRSRPAKSKGAHAGPQLVQGLSSTLSDTVCRVVWNTAYIAWQTIALGQGARQSRF